MMSKNNLVGNSYDDFEKGTSFCVSRSPLILKQRLAAETNNRKEEKPSIYGNVSPNANGKESKSRRNRRRKPPQLPDKVVNFRKQELTASIDETVEKWIELKKINTSPLFQVRSLEKLVE